MEGLYYSVLPEAVFYEIVSWMLKKWRNWCWKVEQRNLKLNFFPDIDKSYLIFQGVYN